MLVFNASGIGCPCWISSLCILITQAFQGWAEAPTIKTLDTIAAPIEDIQFPTVTVCNDYIENPPDNWAFLENVLNQFKFECFNANECNSTEPLRKDFKYVTQQVVDTYTKWLFKEENLGQSFRILEAPEASIVKIATQKIFNLLNEMVSNGKYDFNEMMKYPVNYFQMRIDVLVSDLGLQNSSQSFAENVCNTTICLKTKVLANLIHQITNNNDDLYHVNFGSFLRNFITYDSFNLTEPTYLTKCIMSPFRCLKNVCKRMQYFERKLHTFFADLSSLIGFEEKLSIFELPGLLSYVQNMFREGKVSLHI